MRARRWLQTLDEIFPLDMPIMRLTESLNAWGTPNFEGVFKKEIEHAGTAVLPLQQGLTSGSHVEGDDIRVMLLGATEESVALRVRAGIFYQSIIAGCSCADDPTPVDVLNEYCEMQFDIDKLTAEAKVRLLPDRAETD